jgi:hypothetical protein
MAHLSERANSAKEDKNWLQDAGSLLSIDYSKIILLLIKKEIAKQSPYRNIYGITIPVYFYV